MANTLTTPAVVPSGPPARPRGIIAVASPAPEGWEQGGIQVNQLCPSPVIRDKCITLTPDVPGRPEAAEFPSFMIEQGSECSTLSGGDRVAEAREALNDSTDYALGLTLMSGEANNAPSLSDAVAVGTGAFSDAVAAVAALEAEAAEVGKGQFYVLHAGPGAAAHLASAGMIDSDGRSPSGAQWIISAGYDSADGDDYRIWATGRVWAGVGAIDAYDDVNRPMNNREAWAVRSAIVGFNTCINLTTTFASVTA